MNQENFVIDKKGRKIAVLIPIRIYERLISDSEELDEIKEYHLSKAQKSEAIPFEQAFREIEDSTK